MTEAQDSKEVWRFVQPFWYNTSIGQTERQTEMVEQYRDLHANTMSCCRAKINEIYMKARGCGGLPDGNHQWLSGFVKQGGSPDEVRLEQTPCPFQPH